MQSQQFKIVVADQSHLSFAQIICDEMASSAKARGTGIAKRSPEYIQDKIREGKAVIAFNQDGIWAGFCYIETWSHGEYVANSGLIVAPAFRKGGLARAIKKKIFELSRQTYPEAKIFGLTTGLAVMKINSELGYEPVTYSELTQDEAFWAGCKSCVNYDILMSKDRKNCLCTGMLYDPKDHYEPEETKEFFEKKSKVLERLLRIKQRFLKALNIKDKDKDQKPADEGTTGKVKSLLHMFFNL
ncbi:MAG TPA: GNAT family N-acetyltransferase [Chitinophagaceae bacterium]